MACVNYVWHYFQHSLFKYTKLKVLKVIPYWSDLYFHQPYTHQTPEEPKAGKKQTEKMLKTNKQARNKFLLKLTSKNYYLNNFLIQKKPFFHFSFHSLCCFPQAMFSFFENVKNR